MKQVLTISLLCAWVGAGYGSTEIERRSLQELVGVHPVIEKLDPEEERDGLTAGQLRKDVVCQLEQAGIRVLSREECWKTPGIPYLYVNVNAMKLSLKPAYVYAIGIELKQTAFLTRNPSIVSVASTWRTGTVGIVPTTEMAQKIGEVVGEKVDEFIDDYLDVNRTSRRK